MRAAMPETLSRPRLSLPKRQRGGRPSLDEMAVREHMCVDAAMLHYFDGVPVKRIAEKYRICLRSAFRWISRGLKSECHRGDFLRSLVAKQRGEPQPEPYDEADE